MKPIPGYPNYVACEEGHLYSINYKRTGKTKILKPALSHDGYLKTMLQREDGSYHTSRVHCFIALAYHGSRPEHFDINHKNGIKTDNRPANLEYTTHAENVQHAFDIGLAKGQRGQDNGNAKLSNQDVANIKKHVDNCTTRYYGRKALSEKYGVSECTIKRIATGRQVAWN